MGRVHGVVGELVGKAPSDAGDLHRWVKRVAGINVPKKAVCAGHCAPFEYLRRAYFEGGDLVVWAPRGGGKTKLGAVATLLELLHRPGCQVRIIGGSLEQSLKMWEHLWPGVAEMIDEGGVGGKILQKRIEMANGAGARVLAQSQRAVRGVRVQKIRCDEVELFEEGVWEAVQLATKSRGRDEGGGMRDEGGGVRASVEAISTLHRPFGVMQGIVERAESTGVPVLKWCLMEVLERCAAERECASCPLWAECGGRAKTQCDGFLSIEDAIAMKRRVSSETWESEMMCLRPSVRESVFPTFDACLHVSQRADAEADEYRRWLAIDFGFNSPFVCLYVRELADGRTCVIDEHVQSRQMVDEHLTVIQRKWGTGALVACDPAGNARSDQTGTSNVLLLRRAGFTVKTRSSRIPEGLELIRRAVKTADGAARLLIHPRCHRLIKAMKCYRYDAGGGETPVKDGEHDHLIDALRYYFVNRQSRPVLVRAY